MKIEVRIPESYMGDVMGDLNKRRGKVLGMEMLEDGTQLVIGEAPHSELFEYAIRFKINDSSKRRFHYGI